MRYLVLGGSGLIGYTIIKRLVGSHEVIFSFYNNKLDVPGATAYKLDFRNFEALRKLVRTADADVVIHAVAPPSTDLHERDKQLAYEVNVAGTKVVAEETTDHDTKLVYISTAFVFPSSTQNFDEAAIPAPINYYGVSKLGGELATAYNPNHIIVRTDQIYGWTLSWQKSFVVSTLNKLERQEPVEVCEDWYNSPTYVNDLAATILKLVELDKRGIYHVVGSSYLNRVEWGKKIAHMFGKKPELIVGINSETLNLPAERPRCKLVNKKVQLETGIKLKTVDEGLASMKHEREGGG
jgi:dTDP-4-dehydrorhamnose reductase